MCSDLGIRTSAFTYSDYKCSILLYVCVVLNEKGQFYHSIEKSSHIAFTKSNENEKQ